MNFPPPERSRSGQQTPRQLPRVCNDYNRRGGCTRANCQELHLCTYFLQNRCTAERCNKAHELETPRNILLLEGLGWKGSDDLALALDTLRERARIPQVGVCFRYILDRCPDDSECKYLHLCYRYAKDTCPLGQNRCLYNFSHDLVHDKHNADLLTRFGLYDTPLTEIRSRLKEKMRHTPLEPQLCNHTKDCKGNCLRLHYCEVNLYAHCRHGDRCFKGHSLKNEHNRRVLKYFDWTEDYALKELKKRGRRSASRSEGARTPTEQDSEDEWSDQQDLCEGSQPGPSAETRVRRDNSIEEVANYDDLLDSSNSSWEQEDNTPNKLQERQRKLKVQLNEVERQMRNDKRRPGTSKRQTALSGQSANKKSRK
ncbi:uncharacterized protein LOC122370756 [Amphibalanus amphitrite]|uniref:uncharacterized protein LOC122370756 n=1 Tax=Amphibalanus amphitrite TaxID=1232801 RepID=UPI001C929D6F|nr:uncharacterized protein LOC122370756 [Amphibalanus amphitrite]